MYSVHVLGTHVGAQVWYFSKHIGLIERNREPAELGRNARWVEYNQVRRSLTIFPQENEGLF